MGTKRLAAYAAMYLIWGGSYLAIRYVVEVIPPFFAAGMRYSLASILLGIVSVVVRRRPIPGARQAVNALVSGVVLLTVAYGVVYWAETRLSSWIVAVLVSTVFPWSYLGECLILRRERPTAKMLLPLLAGLMGMPLLLKATANGGQQRSWVAAVAVLCGSCLWAATTLALKRIPLPSCYVQTASLQLVSGGLTFFCLSRLAGEMLKLPTMQQMLSPKPLLGLAYLVIAASGIAFTAFHWLLVHEPPSLIASASYVNPVVAMLLGIAIGRERASAMQLAGAGLIVSSLVAIWSMQRIRTVRFASPKVETLGTA